MSRLLASFARSVLLWGLFFVTCLSLGYPTLNRYDPGATQPSDAAYYAELVERGISETPESHWRYRVLVPYVAMPIRALAEGRIGTWDPVRFALLAANGLFVATTALALVLIAGRIGADARVGILAALMFLTHFNVSNLYLAGLVDSAEVCLMTLLALALLSGGWRWLPVLGLVGGFARETFVPLSVAFAAGWYVADPLAGRWRRDPVVSIAAMGALGLVVVTGLRLAFAPDVVWPWEVAGTLAVGEARVVGSVVDSFLNRNLVYTFGWLLPLGLVGVGGVPGRWLSASAVALAVAAVLAVWAGAGDNIGRPLFSAVGPVLLLASAWFLWTLFAGPRPDAPPAGP